MFYYFYLLCVAVGIGECTQATADVRRSEDNFMR